MSEHTKGPWAVEYIGHGEEEYLNVVAEDGGAIIAGVEAMPLWTEQEANANLIAAAPDLLALVEGHEYSQIAWLPDSGDTTFVCPDCNATEIAGHAPYCPRQAALAKVRGDA